MVSSEQRRRQLAREKFERQQQRREAARRKARRRNTVIAAALAVVVAAGGAAYAAGVFSGDGDGRRADAALPVEQPRRPSRQAARRPEPKMAVGRQGEVRHGAEDQRAATSRSRMDAAKTPHTVNSFKYLADKGFFDNTKCHRLTTQGIYVLQCGDPTGHRLGRPRLHDSRREPDRLGKAGADGTVTYPAGTVAMANTGQAHTGGSQFFLVYKDSKLPPTYTPFGTIDAAGLKAVQDVAKEGVEGGAGDGAPKKAVTIEKATVTKE